MVNGTTNGTGVVAGVNGNGATGSGNVVNREPTASPAQHGVNSPHLAGNVGANSPSPVPGAAGMGQQATTSRGAGNHYFNMNTATTPYTSEQLQVVRMHMVSCSRMGAGRANEDVDAATSRATTAAGAGAVDIFLVCSDEYH